MKITINQIFFLAPLSILLACGAQPMGSAPCTGPGGGPGGLNGAVCGAAGAGATRLCNWMGRGDGSGNCLCTGVPLAWLCKENENGAIRRPRLFPDDPATTTTAARLTQTGGDLCARQSSYNVNVQDVTNTLNSKGVDIVGSSGTAAINYVGSLADLASSVEDAGSSEISVSSDFVCNAGTALQAMGVSDQSLNTLYTAVFGK